MGGEGVGGGRGRSWMLAPSYLDLCPAPPPPLPSPPALSPQRKTADQSSIRPRHAQPFPTDTNPQVFCAGHKTFLNGGECGVNVIYPKTWLDKFMKTLAFAVNSACLLWSLTRSVYKHRALCINLRVVCKHVMGCLSATERGPGCFSFCVYRDKRTAATCG